MPELLEELVKTYEAGAATLNALLDDITWRRPDVEMEEKVLKDMKIDGSGASKDDIESQEIVAYSARQVLEDVIKEARELDVALKNAKAEIEKLAAAPRTASSSSDPGETLP